MNSNQFIDLGINPDSRPESLELSEFLKIIKYLSETGNG
jgi:16S rRNA A1518/A1519 N6-dimethyltransferase RsmA/KsgA/DIM1 with predicted DNA glycosylase/AP lyase activity